jgi:hypothetical protein
MSDTPRATFYEGDDRPLRRMSGFQALELEPAGEAAEVVVDPLFFVGTAPAPFEFFMSDDAYEALMQGRTGLKMSFTKTADPVTRAVRLAILEAAAPRR